MKKYIILLILLYFAGKLTAQEYVWKPEHTEYWNNQPTIVTPGEGTQPPSGTIVLFDGKDLSEWQHADWSGAKWKIENGCFTVVRRTSAIQITNNE